jgi:hypothetical protein
VHGNFFAPNNEETFYGFTQASNRFGRFLSLPFQLIVKNGSVKTFRPRPTPKNKFSPFSYKSHTCNFHHACKNVQNSMQTLSSFAPILIQWTCLKSNWFFSREISKHKTLCKIFLGQIIKGTKSVTEKIYDVS